MNSMENKIRCREMKESFSRDIRNGVYGDGFIPSEASLCKSYSVSRTTVRKILKQLEDEKLLDSSKGKGWFVRKSEVCHGSSMKSIAVWGSRNFQNSYTVVYEAIKKNAEKAGVHIELSLVEKPSSLMSCSVLICLGVFRDDEIADILSYSRPTIWVGMEHPQAKISITTDNYHGGYMAAEYLLSCNHRKFMVVTTGMDNIDNAFSERIRGFCDCLQKMQDTTETVDTFSFSYKTPSVLQTIQGRLKSSSQSAIFITTDLLAPIIMGLCNENGISIPENISFLGYDNMINTDNKPDISFDSIEQPWEDIGRYAFEYANLLYCGQLPENGVNIRLRPRIIRKGSVRNLSGGK